MQKLCANQAVSKFLSEREMVQALVLKDCKPLDALPGMTGTGAPVTERLRYPLLRIIRVVPRIFAPIFG